MNNDTTLQEWIAPRLMRLNQVDGTDKHLDLTEGVGGFAPVANVQQTVNGVSMCSVSSNGTGGQAVAGAVCGPS